MYCAKCGNMVADGQRYCTKCGAPVAHAMGAGSPAPAAAPVPTSPAAASPKRANRAYIAVFGSVFAIVVAAAVGILATGVVPPPAPGGTDNPIQCTQVTRLYPKDAEGNALDDYQARLVDESTGAEVASVDVEGSDGFAIGDLGADGVPLPPGRYRLVVIDNSSGQSYDYGSLDLADETADAAGEPAAGGGGDWTSSESGRNASGSDLVLTPKDDGDASAQAEAADEAYLAKIEEYQERYGEQDLEQDGDFTYITGLAYAGLADFGGGRESLVVCYADPDEELDAEDFKTDREAYTVEVWHYVEPADSSSAKSASGNGSAFGSSSASRSSSSASSGSSFSSSETRSATASSSSSGHLELVYQGHPGQEVADHEAFSFIGFVEVEPGRSYSYLDCSLDSQQGYSVGRNLYTAYRFDREGAFSGSSDSLPLDKVRQSAQSFKQVMLCFRNIGHARESEAFTETALTLARLNGAADAWNSASDEDSSGDGDTLEDDEIVKAKEKSERA